MGGVKKILKLDSKSSETTWCYAEHNQPLILWRKNIHLLAYLISNQQVHIFLTLNLQHSRAKTQVSVSFSDFNQRQTVCSTFYFCEVTYSKWKIFKYEFCQEIIGLWKRDFVRKWFVVNSSPVAKSKKLNTLHTKQREGLKWRKKQRRFQRWRKLPTLGNLTDD